MEQLRVPGTLGRLVHLNLVAKWDDRWGWEIQVRHKHRMEDRMCLAVERYEAVNADEAIEAVCAIFASAHYPHSWLSSDPPTCSPDVPD